MMRLPRFRYRAPHTVAEAALWLADAPGETMLLAGGTDLLPNMKRRQQTPRTIVIGLRGIAEAAGSRVEGTARDRRWRHAYHPGARRTAARDVPGPVAGRCASGHSALAYDGHARRQPVPRHALHLLRPDYEWRKAIDFCMKKDGGICWVATSSPRCLAVSSSDTAPMLQALDARVRLVSASGEREFAGRRSLRRTTACST